MSGSDTHLLRPKVLLVDDQEGNLLALQIPLRSLDCECVPFTSARDAVDYLKKHEVAVILLDVKMPVIDGFEAAALIRQIPTARITPIIFVTGYEQNDDHVAKAYETRGADFIFKPVNELILKSKVSVFLELYHSREKHARDQRASVEAKYKDLVDSIDHAVIWSADPENMQFSFISPRTQLITGYTRDEWMQEPGFFFNHIPPADHAIVRELIADAIKGDDRGIEHRFRHKNGGIVWLHTGMRRAERGSGVGWEIRGLSTDVTAIMEAKSASKASEEKFRALSESLPAIVFISDDNGNTVHLNSRWYQYTGIQVGDLSSENWVRSIHPDDLVAITDSWADANKHKAKWTQEYRLKRHDGVYRWHRGTSIPELTSDGGIFRWIGTVTDIDDQKRFQDEIAQSRQQFVTLANSIPQLTWMAEPNGDIKWFNQRWYDYTGTNEDNPDHDNWKTVHHPEILPQFMERWGHSLKTGEDFEMTYPLKSAEGKFRYFLTRAIPVRNDSGAIVKWFGTNTDVQNQRDIATDLKLKSDALENSLNGFDIVNEDGTFVYANRAYIRMWGYDSFEEILDTTPADHCVDPEIPARIISTLKKTGICDLEFKAKRKDGSAFDVRIWAFLAHDSNGNEIYPTTSIDVSDQKLASSALLQAKVEAERANELKSAFLANMSHEIRTPLGAMLGFADLLRDPRLSPEEHTKYIDVLIRNGEQLSLIINDILDLSKVEAGYLTLERLPVRPREIVTDVLSLLTVKANEKNLALTYTSDESTPAPVISDPGRIRQILINLVSNAIKFTPSGSITIRSYGSAGAGGARVTTFDIVDTGIGIQPGHEEQIFEMFVQADGTMTRRFGGTGLGLSLSRKLAQALGGNISVVSAGSNKGSTFRFTFKDSQGDGGFGSLPPERVKAPEPSARGAKPLAGVRVLVVDDSDDNQQLISLLLRRAGAESEIASNGAIACQVALAGRHDIVLMDIQMPIMDGYTATQNLRTEGYEKPIIALTAHAMAEVREKCMMVGCNDHLAKPIDSKELIAMVLRYAGTGPAAEK